MERERSRCAAVFPWACHGRRILSTWLHARLASQDDFGWPLKPFSNLLSTRQCGVPSGSDLPPETRADHALTSVLQRPPALAPPLTPSQFPMTPRPIRAILRIGRLANLPGPMTVQRARSLGAANWHSSSRSSAPRGVGSPRTDAQSGPANQDFLRRMLDARPRLSPQGQISKRGEATEPGCSRVISWTSFRAVSQQS